MDARIKNYNRELGHVEKASYNTSKLNEEDKRELAKVELEQLDMEKKRLEDLYRERLHQSV